MSDIGHDTAFTGTDVPTASHFLRMVRLDALQQDRSKDDEWIAQWAAAHLDGPALFWYEELSQEIQESWRLLRREILIRWPPPNSNATATSSGASTGRPKFPVSSPPSYGMIGAPATTLPPVQTPIARRLDNEVRRGRIRAVAQNGRDLGFLSQTPDSDNDYRVSRSEEEAMVVSFTPSNQPHEMRVSDTELLGVTFHLTRGPTEIEKEGMMHGGVGLFSRAPGSSDYIAASKFYKGETRIYIWNVLVDGTIIMSCYGPRSRYILEPCISETDGTITAMTSFKLLKEQWGTEDFNEIAARLVFDPIS